MTLFSICKHAVCFSEMSKSTWHQNKDQISNLNQVMLPVVDVALNKIQPFCHRATDASAMPFFRCRFSITSLRSFHTPGLSLWSTPSLASPVSSWFPSEASWWAPSMACWAPSPRGSPCTHESSSHCLSSSTATWPTSLPRSSTCRGSCRKSEQTPFFCLFFLSHLGWIYVSRLRFSYASGLWKTHKGYAKGVSCCVKSLYIATMNDLPESVKGCCRISLLFFWKET